VIIFGSASQVVSLGHGETTHCSVCDTDRSFSLVLYYEFEHVYFVFGYVKHKQYALVCDVCQGRQLLNAAEVEKDLGRVPIPFMRRSGCLVLFFVLLALFLCSLLFGLSWR
jgi:hypothetical protein